MEFRDLTYVCTIAQCGSISKAAEKLFMAQSSLSQFLKNYEENFGQPLFFRTNRGLKPTYAGELYVDTAEQIMGLRRNLMNQLADLSDLKKGRVIFALSSYRAPYLLPVVIPKFQEQYPNITVEIVEASMKEQEALLMNSVVDMGFVSPPLNNSSILLETVIEEEVLLTGHEKYGIGAKAHPPGPSGRPWIDIQDFLQELFLFYSVDHKLRSFVEQLFAQHQCQPKIIQSHDSFETIIRLASAGMGLTFLPETYIEGKNNLQYYSIGEKGMFRTLALGFPPTGYVSKATRIFAETVKETVKSQKWKGNKTINHDIFQ